MRNSVEPSQPQALGESSASFPLATSLGRGTSAYHGERLNLMGAFLRRVLVA
jgi:hypothetical protein